MPIGRKRFSGTLLRDRGLCRLLLILEKTATALLKPFRTEITLEIKTIIENVDQ